MSKPLHDLLKKCVTEASEKKGFSLYVRGSRHDQNRELTGYCIIGQLRVEFKPDETIWFSLQTMQNMMKSLGFDFMQRPVGKGTANQTWLMLPTVGPEKFNYMTGGSAQAVQKIEQEERFEQIREFINAYGNS